MYVYIMVNTIYNVCVCFVAWQEFPSDFEVHADQVQEEERPSDPQPQQRPGIAQTTCIMFSMYIMVVSQWLTCTCIYIFVSL